MATVADMAKQEHLHMLEAHTVKHGICVEEMLNLVSDDAKVAGGVVFGMMGSNGELRFGMKESRPSDRMESALAELVAAGLVTRDHEHGGAVVYRPSCNLGAFRKWARANMGRMETDLRYTIAEPIVNHK